MTSPMWRFVAIADLTHSTATKTSLGFRYDFLALPPTDFFLS
ncbi:MAG: hypothetical protein V7K42_00915 [Nostoc sp.]